MPSESGVTSSSSTSLTSPLSTPPWMAAPTATTSSGFTPLCGSLPKYSFTICWIFGTRVVREMRVAVGRLDLDDPLAHVENRDIERAAAEIVDGDRFVLLLVEPVGERGRGRLVDDAEDVQPRDLAGVFRGLPLCVVEVRG